MHSKNHKKLKILHTVEQYAPSIGGMQSVVQKLSERLSAAGHEVHVATSQHPERNNSLKNNNITIHEFNISGNQVRGLQGEIENYKNFLLKTNFNIITNFAAQQWATDIMLPLLNKINAKKVFVPTGFSALYDKKYNTYFNQMKNYLNEYDMNVFLSDNYRDINFAREHNIQNLIIIPNGADEKEFMELNYDKTNLKNKYGIAEDMFIILLVGSHTNIKGHAEAINIFKKLQIQDCRLFIIANTFGNTGCTKTCLKKAFYFNCSLNALFQQKKIIIKSFNREDTISLYKRADLFLFPSNLECSPLVLFESIASSTPFLSADVGNAKEIIQWSGGGELLPTKDKTNGYTYVDIEQSVKLVKNLYTDKKKRLAYCESGRQAWKKNFTWHKIAQIYEELYYSLIKL